MKELYRYRLVDETTCLEECTAETLDEAMIRFDVGEYHLEYHYKGMAVISKGSRDFGITWHPERQSAR